MSLLQEPEHSPSKRQSHADKVDCYRTLGDRPPSGRGSWPKLPGKWWLMDGWKGVLNSTFRNSAEGVKVAETAALK